MKLILCFYGPTEFCQLPSDSGEGPNFIFALYYDADKDRCSPFIYKGEGGNDNRFSNERDCVRNCSSNAAKLYPVNGKIIINICISMWLLGGSLRTLE